LRVATRCDSPKLTWICGPQSAISSGPMLSWQLPKWSTHSTSPTRPSSSCRGSGTMPGRQLVGIDERAELGEVDTVAQVRGDRGEDVGDGERHSCDSRW
jgi:hypothetical protein